MNDHTHTHTNGNNNNNNKKNNKLPCIVVHVVLYSVVLVTIVQCVFWYVFILYIKMNERNLTNFGLYLLVWQENTNQMRWWWSSQWQPSIIVAIEEPYINTQQYDNNGNGGDNETRRQEWNEEIENKNDRFPGSLEVSCSIYYSLRHEEVVDISLSLSLPHSLTHFLVVAHKINWCMVGCMIQIKQEFSICLCVFVSFMWCNFNPSRFLFLVRQCKIHRR